MAIWQSRSKSKLTTKCSSSGSVSEQSSKQLTNEEKMKTIKNVMTMMGICAMAAFSAPALAADAPASTGLTFGIVDMNKVMQTTDAAKGIFSQMEVKRKEYQAQISKEEDSLRSSGQALEKQKDTLAKDAFEEKGKALQEKFMQEQKVVQDRKKILDMAF